MLIFIAGGVRSGKSSFAEKLAEQIVEKNLNYLATSLAYDEEMSERIRRHQETRGKSKAKWNTWEKSREIHQLVRELSKGDVVVLDCLTTLLSNELFTDWDKGTNLYEKKAYREQVIEKILQAIVGFSRQGTCIVVSNEVGFEPIAIESGTFYYTKLLGDLHQRLVEEADEAYLVEHGIIQKWKGSK